jgi:hypothetical protein
MAHHLIQMITKFNRHVNQLAGKIKCTNHQGRGGLQRGGAQGGWHRPRCRPHAQESAQTSPSSGIHTADGLLILPRKLDKKEGKCNLFLLGGH